MTTQRSSYYKTTFLVGFGASFLLIAGYVAAASLATLGGSLSIIVWSLSWVFAAPLLLALAAGLVVLYRDSRLTRGLPDLFIQLNRTRTESNLAGNGSMPGSGWRSLLRSLFGSRQLVVGEWVTIRSIEEIEKTLDANGTLDGLPFQPEMERFCGKRARVYRCVDKIYDYGGKKNVRRLQNTVLLGGFRCDGSSHDGCQAACHLMWKTDWVTRDPKAVSNSAIDSAAAPRPSRPQVSTDSTGTARYKCQFTQLVEASTLLSPRDLRQDLRPLLAGNLTIPAALVAWLTRLFNRVQLLRGGIGYPSVPIGSATTTPVVRLDLKPGDRVHVLPLETIGSTLDKRSRNRGLWFDVDMVKHCRQPRRVLQRVDRIIDDATGQMREMKTPCIVLEGVSYSGEGLRFCFQEDPTFWREAWLTVAPEQSEAQSASRTPEASKQT